MPLKAGRGGKLDVRFYKGTYLGTNLKNGESIIGTEQGAVGARTVRRLPPESQWDGDALTKLKGTPWAPAGDAEEEPPVAVQIELPARPHQLDHHPHLCTLPKSRRRPGASTCAAPTSRCTASRRTALAATHLKWGLAMRSTIQRGAGAA